MMVLYWSTHFQLNNNNLKIIRQRTGNQCNSFKTGVMWSYFRVLVNIMAAAFWASWSFANRLSLILYSKAFPLSSLDVIRACMIVAAESWDKVLHGLTDLFYLLLHWHQLSNITPKLRANEDTAVEALSTCIAVWSVSICWWNLDVMTRNSVLSSFSFIHDLISIIQASAFLRADNLSAGLFSLKRI